MIKLKKKMEVKFSIIVIIFSLALFISTIFFPWISLKDIGNDGEEFHLNYKMMLESKSPEINHIANRLNSINNILLFSVIFGLFSLLSVSYHVAYKTSKIGYFLIISSNIMIILISLSIFIDYFSVIFYINDAPMIALSSPFAFFSYSFISLIGSVIFLIISGMYGGYITGLIILQYKDIRTEMKKFSGLQIFNHKSYKKDFKIKKCKSEKITGVYSVTEKNDELPVLSIDNPKESGVENSEEFDDTSEEFIIEEPNDENIEDEIDGESHVPFSFNKSVKKPKNPLVDNNEKREITNGKNGEEPPSPFPFDKVVEKPKKTFFEKEDNKQEKITGPFPFDKKEEKINEKEEEIDLKNLKQDLHNQKSREIIEQGRIEVQRDFQKDNVVKPHQTIETSVKNDGKFQGDGQISIDLIKKTSSVICPNCKHIFSATKTGDVSYIKCPMCGKEGIMK